MNEGAPRTVSAGTMNSHPPPTRVRGRLKVDVDKITERDPRKVAQRYGADVMFAVLLWLVRKAAARDRKVRDGRSRPPCIGLLYGAAKSLGYDYADSDMVVLTAARWRERVTAALRIAQKASRVAFPFAAAGFSRGKRVIVPASHTVVRVRSRDVLHDDGRSLRTCALADYIGRELRVQPNPYHPEARWIEDVRLVVSPRGFALDVWYGFRQERGSHWRLHNENRRDGGSEFFVRSVHGETFAEFLDRAHATLSRATIEVAEVPWFVWQVAIDVRPPDPVLVGRVARGFVFAPTMERALACWQRHDARPAGDVLPRILPSDMQVATLPGNDTSRECAVSVYRATDADEVSSSDAFRVKMAMAESLLRMSGAPYRSAVERFWYGWILPDERALR